MARVPISFDYQKDPKVIYRQSFAAIKDALSKNTIPVDIGPVAQRIIHACGMPDSNFVRLRNGFCWDYPQSLAS